MSTQIRPMGGMPYAPFRDIANNFVGLVRLAINQLDENHYLVQKYLVDNGITEDQLGEAAKCVAEWINQCMNVKCETPGAALDNSGFMNLPVPVQLVITAKIGEIVMSFYWSVIRDALMAGEKQAGLDELMFTTEKVCSKFRDRRLGIGELAYNIKSLERIQFKA